MTHEMLEMLFEAFWEGEFKLHYNTGSPCQMFIPLPELSKLDKNELAELKPKVREVFNYFWVFLSNEGIKMVHSRMEGSGAWTPLCYLLKKCAKLDEEIRSLRGSLKYMQKKERGEYPPIPKFKKSLKQHSTLKISKEIKIP